MKKQIAVVWQKWVTPWQLVSTLEAQIEESQKTQKTLAGYAEQTKQQAHRMTILNEVAQAVSTLRDLPSVFEIIFEQTHKCLPLDAFFISLYDDNTNEISFPIMYDDGRRWQEPTQPVTPDSYVLRLVNTGKPFLKNRTAQEIKIPPEDEEMVGDTTRKSASLMFAPLVTSERVIGAISAQSYRLNAYNDDDLVLFSGIGHQTAIAIENARLYSSIQQELFERKRIEAEREAIIVRLEMQNAELERFTYTVSHDLKSPIITIRNFLGFLKQDAQTGNLEQFQSDLQRIDEASYKMALLLDDLLELSRIGRVVNPPERVPFVDVVQGAMALTDGLISKRGVIVEVDADLPVVNGDRVRLVEVLQNLIENAIKYMGEQDEPIIRIGSKKIDGSAVFYVQDNGVGVPTKYQQKVFGLFEKLDPQTEGSGIGLALIKRIVEVHNGRLWMESEGECQGSTFYFTLNESDGESR